MLRTKSPGQLVGLVRTYMFDGRHGRLYVLLVSALTVGLVIPSLTAYVMGGGAIISSLLGLPAWAGHFLFLLPGAAVVWVGLKAVGRHPSFDPERLMRFSAGPLAAALPVGIFTSMSQSLVPEIVRGLAHDPKSAPTAIKWGLGINLLFLLIFPMAIFGLQDPLEISQVVTISWGQALGPVIYFAVNLFALLALLTSFWGGAGAAMGNVVEIFRFRSEWDIGARLAAFAVTIAPSLVLTLIGRFDFVDMIQTAGSVGGVILAVLPIFILRRARQLSEREPEYNVGVLYSPVVKAALFIFYVGVLVYAAFAR